MLINWNIFQNGNKTVPLSCALNKTEDVLEYLNAAGVLANAVKPITSTSQQKCRVYKRSLW